MARMLMFPVLILLAVSSGCSTWNYSDPTVKRAMNYQTPENVEPGVIHGSKAITDYANYPGSQ